MAKCRTFELSPVWWRVSQTASSQQGRPVGCIVSRGKELRDHTAISFQPSKVALSSGTLAAEWFRSWWSRRPNRPGCLNPRTIEKIPRQRASIIGWRGAYHWTEYILEHDGDPQHGKRNPTIDIQPQHKSFSCKIPVSFNLICATVGRYNKSHDLAD